MMRLELNILYIAHAYPMNTVLDCVCKVIGIDRSVSMTRQRDSLLRPIAAKLCVIMLE